MKKITVTVLIFILSCLILCSCNNTNSTGKTDTKAEKQPVLADDSTILNDFELDKAILGADDYTDMITGYSQIYSAAPLTKFYTWDDVITHINEGYSIEMSQFLAERLFDFSPIDTQIIAIPEYYIPSTFCPYMTNLKVSEKNETFAYISGDLQDIGYEEYIAENGTYVVLMKNENGKWKIAHSEILQKYAQPLPDANSPLTPTIDEAKAFLPSDQYLIAQSLSADLDNDKVDELTILTRNFEPPSYGDPMEDARIMVFKKLGDYIYTMADLMPPASGTFFDESSVFKIDNRTFLAVRDMFGGDGVPCVKVLSFVNDTISPVWVGNEIKDVDGDNIMEGLTIDHSTGTTTTYEWDENGLVFKTESGELSPYELYN